MIILFVSKTYATLLKAICASVLLFSARKNNLALKELNKISTAVNFYCSEHLSHRMTKPTKYKMSVCPAKTQISLGIHPVWSELSLSAWRNLGSFATHWWHSEDWSDWVDAQTDLSLLWEHTHFVDFIMLWLIYSFYHSISVWWVPL